MYIQGKKRYFAFGASEPKRKRIQRKKFRVFACEVLEHILQFCTLASLSIMNEIHFEADEKSKIHDTFLDRKREIRKLAVLNILKPGKLIAKLNLKGLANENGVSLVKAENIPRHFNNRINSVWAHFEVTKDCKSAVMKIVHLIGGDFAKDLVNENHLAVKVRVQKPYSQYDEAIFIHRSIAQTNGGEMPFGNYRGGSLSNAVVEIKEIDGLITITLVYPAWFWSS